MEVALSSQLSSSAASAELEKNSRHSHLSALLEISLAMGREVHLVNVLRVIMQKTTELLEAERSSLFLYDGKKDELWSMVAQGLEIEEIRFPSGTGIAGDVAATLKTANIPDAWEDPRFNPDFDKKTGFRTRSVLCMPLINSEGALTGVIQALNKKDGGIFQEDDELLMEALGAQSIIAVERALMVEEHVERQRMQEVLSLARDIETSMMPKGFSEPSDKFGIDLAAVYDPATEVGGDFYDFFMLDDRRLCFTIGDVSGKGMPAALFMVMAKTFIRAIGRDAQGPSAILTRVNEELCRDNEKMMFVTVFLAIIDVRTGMVSYCNGGHNPPYVLCADGSIRMLQREHGPLLGIDDAAVYKEDAFTLGAGDAVYLYTDGVDEAYDADGELYSIERLEAVLSSCAGFSSGGIIERLRRSIKDFARGAAPSDDITMLVLKYAAGRPHENKEPHKNNGGI
jgi:sigma-B regulation protein RsbU (phosphoserine phosphatase)